MQYAENPPKKYQDIYPFDFESEDWQGLWEALKAVVDFWVGHGVKIFRVDNPHTKPFAFWEWLISEVKRDHPDVIFLAEAFTRPKVMYRLAKLGFTQSYTYFTWRTTKAELIEYFTELTTTEVKEFFRPNLWPNTPDILATQLQAGGRPGFVARLVLAATLSTSYGIYGPAFEMAENLPIKAGSEEYLDSEKYEFRSWDLHRMDSLGEVIARVNLIRRGRTRPLQGLAVPLFQPVDNTGPPPPPPPTLWYKDAVIYEVHVRAFYDSNGDGIGDFRGLTEKLDYLQDLGVTAIWLLPFYPSPLRDDGYDIADYTGRPSRPTARCEDFKTFLREAHARGLQVITELVLNHTSDQHPWFQRARRAPPGPVRATSTSGATRPKVPGRPHHLQGLRDVQLDLGPGGQGLLLAPLLFPPARPELRQPRGRSEAIFRVVDFWLDMGVDGLRLDAVPYLFEREGTNCENLPGDPRVPEGAAGARRRAKFPDRMLLAEANQWPEDAVAYFGQGDECHMAFHFPLMPRLFMSIRMEDRFPIIDILEQTPPIPETCQWALFLRNHDELTLEMVTDEERDYMYRAYANDPQARINLGIRRRLAPLLGNDRRRIELMNGLLFSLPGTPVLYYGDEIGMGDNIYLGDRNGVRTPMQWSGDRNAGFSRANRQRLYLPVITDPEYHYETVNVEAQQNNPNSLLWWTKRLDRCGGATRRSVAARSSSSIPRTARCSPSSAPTATRPSSSWPTSPGSRSTRSST